MIIGWIALVIIMMAFFILNIKFSKWFLLVDLLGTILFLVHAIVINDGSFIVMNGFISIMIVWKIAKGGLK